MKYLLLATGAVAALALPWLVYPPVAVDIAVWVLFAIAVDLLLGFTGLLSFGHAAFWGTAAYTTGIVALHTGVPFPLAVLAGALAAAALAVPIGYLSVRRTGIYFAMVTLAFAQMMYFIANQWRGVTGGENGLQGIPRRFFGVDLSDPFYFYYAALPIVGLGVLAAWRIVHSPFGRVLVAIRDNPARAQALGYPVARYKLLAFVLSATLVVLGGIGTLWGAALGAALVVQLEDVLATAGFDGTGIVTGAVFVAVVLLFRRGMWGTATLWLSRLRTAPFWRRGRRTGAPPAPPDEQPASKLDLARKGA